MLQDDVQLCSDFSLAAARAIEARPDCAICFFVGGQPGDAAHRILAAQKRREVFTSISPRRWVPAVALAWPTQIIPDFLDYVNGQNWPDQFVSDDEAFGRFFRENGTEIVATVPSLVEHPDEVESLIGRRARGGLDRGRVAAWFIGDADPLEIVWN